MLQSFLNLEGVAVLDKKQQLNVNGGQTCKFTTISDTGTEVQFSDGFSEGAAGSEEAQGVCGWLLSGDMGTTRCFYDCEYDGFGQ